MLARLVRDTAIACGLFMTISLLLWPGQWRIPFGIAGGGLLMGLSLWAIRGAVDGWLGGYVGQPASGSGQPSGPAHLRPTLGLVKFFTRYAMLGFAAYVMMARLHLDPVGMLAGVSALGVAAGVEAVRGVKAPRADRRG